MWDWRAFLIRELPTLDGVAVATAFVLFGLAWLLLPKERRLLRMPAALFALHVALVANHRAMAEHAELRRPLAVLSLLFLLIAIGRVAFLLVFDWLIDKRLGKHMPRIFRDIAQGIVYVFVAVAVLRAVGVDLGSLLTTSAILTAVIGLSLQETLGNLFAGLALHTERPFDAGDWVQLGDGNRMVGQVLEINWRATKLRTKDRTEIIVPNGIIAKTTIQNLSRPSPVMRRILPFQGPFGVAPNRIRTALAQALRGCPGVLAEPAPKIWTAGFGESGIDYQIVFFIDRFEISGTIESDARDRIAYALDRAKISMPFPVRELVRATRDPGKAGDADLVAALERTEVLDLLPRAVLERVAAVARPAVFGAGETMVFQGDRADDMYVIVEGEVAVVTGSSPDQTTELTRLGPGQLFGELAMLTGVRGASVRAVVDTKVLSIALADFRVIVADVPGLGDAIAKRLSERQSNAGTPKDDGQADASEQASVGEVLFHRIRRFFGNND
jgi:small-conductance mechanosensitive channel/CRP-like cAMP-binding protein